MRLKRDGERYVLECSFDERFEPKSARFRWDPATKAWWTDDKKRASQFANVADEELRGELDGLARERAANLEASMATEAAVEVPSPEGLSYLPFQKAGIAYAMARQSTLIGDEMGLGKTIQAIGVANADESVKRVLVICPASLKLNWLRELGIWLVRDLSIGIADSKTWPRTDIVIVNYDVLHKHAERLRTVIWDLLVVDECHYIKNPKARRSAQVYGSKKRGKVIVKPIEARRRLFLTGTPIVNRPAELYPVLSAIDGKEWGSWWSFGKRYCDAHHNGFGWDFSGASNLDELHERLRAVCMVRRLKRDVLPDLPAKRRQIIELSTNGSTQIVERERQAWARYQERVATLEAKVAGLDENDKAAYENAVAELRATYQVAFTEMSLIRHETAVAKIPYVIEHLHNAIDEDPEHKVILFAHHKDVLLAIAKEFGSKAVLVYGEVKIEDRQVAVDRFQKDPGVQVFVGGIQAAGVGLTLTAASHVVFAELDWVPGNVSQAEDRCHRIGQRESVLVQHLVFDGSMDATIAKTIVRKQRVIDKALDGKIQPRQEIATAVAPVPRPSNGRAMTQPGPEVDMAPEQVEAIHEGLRMLAGRCDGALAVDGAGFSKLDARFGRDLAQASRLSAKQAFHGQRLVRKYRRQLPVDVIERAGL